MIKLAKLGLNIGMVLFLSACATSMSPLKVNNTLPILTKSKFIPQSEVDSEIKRNGCKYLVKGREYTAPIGLTTKNDLKNGAKGIDEWVKLDGGNAYVLRNYNWNTVDHLGSTQLHIEFDTMVCE
ncbi:hypothetical protein [Parapedobacter sp. 10938]|uniref:hypothetical protein n=1 Tax=Parapedobacter flavus TaxID=3110225 RepID=UPI002DB7CE89|nr:hypothetical protein [Parapedobacter sp. 10938]MEC3881620.1 hypothetical protein [Parapedobacter sp. 10938]